MLKHFATSSFFIVLWLAQNFRAHSQTYDDFRKRMGAKVSLKADASVPDENGRQEIVLTLAIEKGYSIYANSPGSDDFESVKTKIDIRGLSATEVKIDFPPGKAQEIQFTNDKIVYKIYESELRIRVSLLRGEPRSDPINIRFLCHIHSPMVCGCPVVKNITIK